MSGDSEKSTKKWNIIKEQLIALCALNKSFKGSDEFKKLLSEDIELKSLNAQTLTSICYFVLGIIDSEERDKLIQWPLINIKTHTKFRKGMSALVKNFQEKYPWSHIKKLPESYFMNPHGYQSRVLDFLLRLTNLAIHVALDVSDLLLMHSGDGLNSNEIAVMNEIVSRAREEEEMLMKNKVLPLKEIEIAKNEVCDKCIALKQENDDLQQKLQNLKKQGLREDLIPNGEKVDINVLKEIRKEKFLELDVINKELSEYHKVSKELLHKIKAFKFPISLSSKDFGCENSSPDLNKKISGVCGNLCQLFQYISSLNSSKEKEDNFYEQLKTFKDTLMKENEALCSFLGTLSIKQK